MSAHSDTKVVTLGCRLNAYEGQVIREQARAAGLGDAVVVNTCAVTGEAVRQVRQTIRRLRRENPDARLVVTGCAAQVEPEAFAAMGEVDLVLGNAEKVDPAAWRRIAGANDFGLAEAEKVRVNDIFAVREHSPHMIDCLSERTRAFVQVQNGCDHRCTFCIIPFGRGNARSVPVGAAVDQVKRVVERGSPGSGADGRRSDLLRAGSARLALPRRSGAGHPEACPGPAAPAPFQHRFHRGGPGADGRARPSRA